MPNEYIKKSDIEKIIEKYKIDLESKAYMYTQILQLPTINPEGVLEEIIEELKFLWSDYTENPIILLKEAQVRIRNQS